MGLIDLDKLERTYGDRLAFRADALSLGPGCIGLLGPNGAGKTTLLEMLLGLLPPSRGRARVLDIDVTRRPLAVRARTGYMSENDRLLSGYSGLEFVALAGELCGLSRRESRRRAHEVLDYLALAEERYRRIQEYSTGMKQRVKLAQAMVHDPEFLVLDEPTNGLDPSGRRLMLGLISGLYRQLGKSILLSSHLLEDVERVCDSVIVIDRGKVLASGGIDVIRHTRPNRYRLLLSGDSRPLLKSLEAEGVQVLESSERAAFRLEVVVEYPSDFRPQRLFELLVAAGGGAQSGAARDASVPVLERLTPDRERLDDTFRRLLQTRRAAGSASPGERNRS